MPNAVTSNGEVDGRRIELVALARALSETLKLRHPPVAMAFCETRPESIAEFEGTVPSACTLWRLAEARVFFASSKSHVNCPIGVMTMGFAISDELQQRLMDVIATMGRRGYFDPQEAASVPRVSHASNVSGIAYGPLGRFPLTPDVVLVWVSGESGMLLSEAANRVLWGPQTAGQPALGRPSCAAIPLALRRGAPAISLGCAGMRSFTEIDADLDLAVLPRVVLGDLRDRLASVARANAEMTEYYLEQKHRFAPAAV